MALPLLLDVPLVIHGWSLPSVAIPPPVSIHLGWFHVTTFTFTTPSTYLPGLQLPLRFPWPYLSEAAARHLIEGIWPVEAATLALNIAVVVFALQALAQSRYLGPLDRYALRSNLLLPVYVAAASIFVNTVLLLFGGNDQHGSPSLGYGWATLLSLIYLALLPAPFAIVLAALRHPFLLQLWLSYIEEAALSWIEHDVGVRYAWSELAHAAPGAVPDLYHKPSNAERAVTGGVAGVVRDINLCKLRKAVRVLGQGNVVVRVRLGMTVRANTPILYVPSTTSAALVSELKSVAIIDLSAPARQRWLDARSLLYVKSKDAIADSDLAEISDLLQGYEKLFVTVYAARDQLVAKLGNLPPIPPGGDEERQEGGIFAELNRLYTQASRVGDEDMTEAIAEWAANLSVTADERGWPDLRRSAQELAAYAVESAP